MHRGVRYIEIYHTAWNLITPGALLRRPYLDAMKLMSESSGLSPHVFAICRPLNRKAQVLANNIQTPFGGTANFAINGYYKIGPYDMPNINDMTNVTFYRRVICNWMPITFLSRNNNADI